MPNTVPRTAGVWDRWDTGRVAWGYCDGDGWGVGGRSYGARIAAEGESGTWAEVVEATSCGESDQQSSSPSSSSATGLPSEYRTSQRSVINECNRDMVLLPRPPSSPLSMARRLTLTAYRARD